MHLKPVFRSENPLDLEGRVIVLAIVGRPRPWGKGLSPVSLHTIAALLHSGASLLVASASSIDLMRLRRSLKAMTLSKKLWSRWTESWAPFSEEAWGDRFEVLCASPHIAGEADRIFERATERFGTPDTLVSLAAPWQETGALLKQDLGAVQREVSDALIGHFSLMRSILPSLIQNPNASALYQGNLLAERPLPGAGLSGAAEAATFALFRSLMGEHEIDPIRLNAVLFGDVEDTDWRPGLKLSTAPLTAEEAGLLAAVLTAETSIQGSTIRIENSAELWRWLGRAEMEGLRSA